MTGQLITEEEARRTLFSKDSRPSPQGFARLRRLYDLPHVRLGRKVLYWRDELQDHLQSLQKPKPGD